MSNSTLIESLEQILFNMKAGNSNLNEEQQLEILDSIQKITSPLLSKSEAIDYIGVCRTTFEKYVKQGLIPEGMKQRGISTLFWRKCDLDKYLSNK